MEKEKELLESYYKNRKREKFFREIISQEFKSFFTGVATVFLTLPVLLLSWSIAGILSFYGCVGIGSYLMGLSRGFLIMFGYEMVWTVGAAGLGIITSFVGSIFKNRAERIKDEYFDLTREFIDKEYSEVIKDYEKLDELKVELDQIYSKLEEYVVVTHKLEKDGKELQESKIDDKYKLINEQKLIMEEKLNEVNSFYKNICNSINYFKSDIMYEDNTRTEQKRDINRRSREYLKAYEEIKFNYNSLCNRYKIVSGDDKNKRKEIDTISVELTREEIPSGLDKNDIVFA